MPLFQSTSPCGGGSSGSGAAISDFQYEYGSRFNITNPQYLRINGGFGSFSNLVPDILPCDALLVKLTTSARTTETDAYTVEIYRNGILVYSLIKPLGNTSAVQVGGMPSFLQNDAISVRVTGNTLPIQEPKASLVFEEIP